jgi:hypothetical protein
MDIGRVILSTEIRYNRTGFSSNATLPIKISIYNFLEKNLGFRDVMPEGNCLGHVGTGI